MKALLNIGAFLALLAGLWFIYDQGGDARENKIRLEIAARDNQVFENAYQEIVRLKKELQEIEDEIIHEPPSEIRPSDPVIRRYYERLRVRRNTKDI